MTELDHTRRLAALTTETGRLGAALTRLGLGADVPTAPGWDGQRLARHVGDAQRWAEAVVRTRAAAFLSPSSVDDRTPPGDAAGVHDWLVSGCARAVAAFDDAGPDAELWSWADEATSGFWARWALHETLLRRVDAELAAGRAAVLVEPELAADGVDHWLGVLALGDDGPHPLRGAGETVHLHATDTPGEWTLTRTADGLDVARGHHRGDVAVRAPASGLLLLLTRRAGVGTAGAPEEPGGPTVHGERAVLDALLADTDF